MTFATTRLKTVKPSASALISQKAQTMRASGEDVIDLGLGEPDFDTPSHIVEAAHRAALDGQTRYPPTGGTKALKDAVRAKFLRDNGLTFSANEIVVSNGAKQVIFNALMATLEDGDEVILCAPYFDSYRNIVGLLGGSKRIVTCRPENGFRLQPDDLESVITNRTRWLILNAPSNPAGSCYSAEEFRKLGVVLARYPQVLVLSDEIYEHITFDGRPFVSFASACPELAGRILTVNGVSKAYAMTGWRIGYGAGPAELIKSMVTVQSQISSGASAISQAAAVEALNGPQACVEQFRQAFARRRDLVIDAIAETDGLSLITPGGAFYALIDCRRLLGSHARIGTAIDDDVAFTDFLLAEAGIAAVPGSVYDMPGHFRLSTATADDLLKTALARLLEATKLLTCPKGAAA
ncbi:MAG: pyridoxal phosphate-dependent aminotransferase [Geminicoccales bacterium]